MQSSAIIMWSNLAHYCIRHCTAIIVSESESNIRITTNTPYLTLTDKLWGVYCEDFREIDCVITALHCTCNLYVIHCHKSHMKSFQEIERVWMRTQSVTYILSLLTLSYIPTVLAMYGCQDRHGHAYMWISVAEINPKCVGGVGGGWGCRVCGVGVGLGWAV